MSRKIIRLFCILIVMTATAAFSYGAVDASDVAAQGSYKDQLSAAQMGYYDRLEQNYLTDAGMPNGNSSEIVFKPDSQIQITVNTATGNLTSDSVSKINNLYKDIAYAYFAFTHDYPEVFWAGAVKYNVKFSYKSSGIGTITEISITPEVQYTGAVSKTEAFLKGVDSAKKKIISRRVDASDYETVKAIHDFLCETLTYNYAAVGNPAAYPAAHSVGPVFTEANPSVVCEGYGKAFKILCNAFDIPCVMVAGVANDEDHLWNYVQIKDAWYGVDVTWDDQATIMYRYFLKGKSGMADHKPDPYAFSDNGTVRFDYPTLSSSAFQKEQGGESVTPDPDPTPTPEPDPTPCVHNWKAATCKTAKTCTLCGATEGAALGHKAGTAKVTKKATTSKSGTKVQKCTRCNATVKTLKIQPAKISLSKSSFTYTGKYISSKKLPKIVVKDGNGKTISSKYYTVKRPSNVKKMKSIGRYAYKITFKSTCKEYSGSKIVYLQITPKTTSVSSVKGAKKAVTVKWKKGSKSQVSGYQIMAATNSKFTKNAKTVTVKGYSKTSYKVTKLLSKKTYYVKVRTYKTVKGVKIYSGWSKYKKVKTK